MGRKKQYNSQSEKQRAYRQRVKSNAVRNDLALRFKVASSQVVLSLFPGGDLWGRAFEELGFCVVRAPDILWGGDIRHFQAPKGRFDGIIGGAPCQVFSKAAISGTEAINLIPEFERIVSAAAPGWAILENVREAAPYAPRWQKVFLRDWDCGGLTHRSRGFWFHGLPTAPKPHKRTGSPAYSVLASAWNQRGATKLAGHAHLEPKEAARLQGFPELAQAIIDGQPGGKRADGRYTGMSLASRKVLATHMLGNGVPHAMGLYIANHVLDCLIINQQRNGASKNADSKE